MYYCDPIMLTGYVGEDSDVAELMRVSKRMHSGWHRDTEAIDRRDARALGKLDKGVQRDVRDAQRSADRADRQIARSSGLVFVGRLR